MLPVIKILFHVIDLSQLGHFNLEPGTLNRATYVTMKAREDADMKR
jgi:hypothetical protein